MQSCGQVSESTSTDGLSIALIGPDELRRSSVAQALLAFEERAAYSSEPSSAGLEIQEFAAYPLELAQLPQMLAQQFDVVLVDLDGDTECALELVDNLSRNGPAIVMVYSARANRDLVIRCMRAGAREFLNLPITPGDMAGALARVPLRDPSVARARGTGSKLFVFLGTKGGCGVTRIAARFAMALAQDSGRSTLLIDLGLPLGDAALQLGMLCNYSTENALEDWNRLDASFLRSLLAAHASGMLVLAAPKEFPKTQPTPHAINRLVEVARRSFHYVVADVGSRLDLKDSSLFDSAAYLYLITQSGPSELRNANRLINQFFSARRQRLQIVLNRFPPGAPGFEDDRIAALLTRPVQWKIEDEDAEKRGSTRAAIPVVLDESPASRLVRKMARTASGLPPLEERKAHFRLFGGGRPAQSKPALNTRRASAIGSADERGEIL